MGNLDQDIRVLLAFITVYCRCHHTNQKQALIKNQPVKLCPECLSLANYAVKRRDLCPKDPKPACKNCNTHCYSPQNRRAIKEIMKFSGIYFIKRGRLDYLWHYFMPKD